MNIVVSEALQAYIDPLTPDENDALERSLLAEGCRDALVLWGDLLVDGHNRYRLCQQHGLPFQTVQNTRFQSLEDVHLWMIDQHLGRRSVSDFQRGVLALRKRDIVAQRRRQFLTSAAAAAGDAPDGGAEAAPAAAPDVLPDVAPLKSREDIARAARLSSSQVVLIEKIQKQATPEVVAAVKRGSLSLRAAAAVASLPEPAQKEAAQAGPEALKQAAKAARQSKRQPREAAPADSGATDPVAAPANSPEALQQRVRELTAENEALRRRVADLQARLERVSS